jgi:hypothetical protein
LRKVGASHCCRWSSRALRLTWLQAAAALAAASRCSDDLGCR